MSNMDNFDHRWARILNILNPDIFKNVEVTFVGVGSGGGSTAVHLAKNGIAVMNLIDNDILGVENVIRHVCGMKDVGRHKVEAVRDRILDINPNARLKTYQMDVTNDPAGFREIVRRSDLVVGAADKLYVNFMINQVCVEENIPVVFGKVFKKGIGGEVYRYIPGKTGCLACLEAFLQGTGMLYGSAPEDDLNENDWEEIYGMSEIELKTSPGLSIDIDFITLLHARLALDTLLNGRNSHLPSISANYIVWSNRPVAPFKAHFDREFYLVHPRNDCLVCGMKGGNKNG